MSIRLNAGIDHRAFVKDVEKGMRMANKALSKRANTVKLKLDDKGFRQPLGRITGDLNQFDSALAASNARVIAFGASTAVIGGISKAFKELAASTIEVQKAFKDINRILNMSNQGFEKFGNQLFDIAKKNATAFEDVTKGALEFARQGLKTEETLKRTADAMTLVRLTGINADKAVSSLTATVNAFDSAMVTTSSSLNKFVAVETKFAVGARDLVEAIGRVGSSAKDAKVGFDELNAMVTSVQQTTGRGGAVIGNAMKTIFTRLQRQSTLTALESYNIAVRDIEGNTLPAIRILDNFAKTYQTLADGSQAYLREQVAGVFQANILSAIMRDLNKEQSTFSSALKVSKNATNEAAQATKLLNQSLSALASQTATEFKRLQENIGKQTFEPIARAILDPLKAALEGINELIDGEGTGSEIANGILKGIKNVIGGPGLIAVLGIIGKVIFNTVSYMAKALPALVGLTTQTQKRATLEKFISDSLQRDAGLAKLVAQAEGNAATQAGIFLQHAEKAALALDAQEASVAHIAHMMSVANPGAFALVTGGGKGKGARGASGFIPGMAGEVNDIKKGVGGVSPSSKPVTIPNFSFGGGVRGTMIANSGEYIVPNYSNGGSAIFNPNMVAQYGMPKGAKPVRGAQGYVPNFAGDINKALTKLDTMTPGSTTYNSYTAGLADKGILARTALANGPAAIRQNLQRKATTEKKKLGNTYTSSSMAMLFPPGAVGGGAPFYQHNYENLRGKGPTSVRFPAYTYSKKPKGGADDIVPIEANIKDAIFEETLKYAQSVRPPAGDVNKNTVIRNLESAQGGKGAVSAAAGAAFEVGVQTALGLPAAAVEHGKKNLDIPVGSASIKSGGELRELFNQPGPMMASVKGGDFKISPSVGNVKSMAGKIVDLDKAFTGWMAKRGAHGYVPNFAALGDAVEREAAAGVPLSRIRVNRSSKLSGPNNPAGLAVTNTRDEPKGLKDVMGASRGYVPNYALDLAGLTRGVGDPSKGIGPSTKTVALLDSTITKLTQEYQKKIMDMVGMGLSDDQLEIAIKQLTLETKESAQKLNLTQAAQDQLKGAIAQETRELNASAPMGGALQQGGMMGGKGMMAGMALSFAAPMAAGALEQANGGTTATSSALTGAGTGAALGMMIPGPWGVAIGAAIGGIGGFAKEAVKVGKELSVLSSELQEFERTTTETNSAGEAYVQAQKDILTAGTQEELEDAQKRLAANFEKIKGTKLEDDFKKAGTNVNGLTDALDSFVDAASEERMGRRATIAASRFDLEDTGTRMKQHGTQGGIVEFMESFQFAGGKTRAEFIDQFGDLFSGMKLTGDEGKALEDAAKLNDLGLTESSRKDDARTNIRKILKDKGAFKDMSADDIDSFLTVNVLKVMAQFTKVQKMMKETANKETTAKEDQLAIEKQLVGNFIAVNKVVEQAAATAKDAPMNKFKEAFTKLNNAFSSIGADILTVTGDMVGAAKFRAQTGNRGRTLGNMQKRSGFGVESAQKIAGLFSGVITNSQNTIDELGIVTDAFINDPRGGLKALQKAMDPAQGNFRVIRDEQGNITTDEKGKAVSAVMDPAAFIKMQVAAKQLQTAFDKQEKNIEAERLVAATQNQIAIKKAEIAEMEKQMSRDEKYNQTVRSQQLSKEEIISKTRLAELELRRRDPARTRGLTTGQSLLSDQGLDRERLKEEKAMMDKRLAAENAALQAQFNIQQAVIKANYELVGADAELQRAIEELTKEMLAGQFGDFDPTGTAVNYLKDRENEVQNSPARKLLEKNLAERGEAAATMVKYTDRETGQQLQATTAYMARKQLSEATRDQFGTYEEYLARKKSEHAEKRDDWVRGKMDIGAGAALGKGTGDPTTSKEFIDAKNLLKLKIDGSKELNTLEKQRLTEALEGNQELDRQIEARSKDFGAGFQEGFNDIYRDTDKIYNRLGKELPTVFRDGMVNALEQSLDKAETFGDAMRGVAIDFLKTIRRAALTHSMNNFTSLIGMGASKGFRESGQQGFQGGGGAFVPGSGTGDRVPAMLEPGEYVMNRKAVGAMGRRNLDKINFGAAPRFSNGGTMMLNEPVTSSRMSGFFLASDNPELMEARNKAREDYEKKQAKRAKKDQLKNMFLSTMLSVGISKGLGAASNAFKNRGATSSLTGATASRQGMKNFRNMGGSRSGAMGFLESGVDINDSGIPNMQRGGSLSRGFSNRDSVPAYMAGGEFVMNNRAVRKYGLGFMGRLNGGLIPRMQAGGPVAGGAAAAPLNTQSAANTNNISINVSVGGGGASGGGQGGSQSTGNKNADQQSNEDKATQGKELSEKIRSAVVDVIAQEQRLGGSLSKSARQG